ncbi:GNAT family N-acetyltransferase [Shewanella surugensis]|uniref:GNAT family N-acetyltransferase n=1 Tax=Shewanella surugensis TaxID=212020 RepID=A0ABT0LDV2_9GAMM|nr:GNAT family protein [Shewanella surugensis]MCL1125884.1 GNAT family N-acetyltransferase [Shewanella surugensis]
MELIGTNISLKLFNESDWPLALHLSTDPTLMKHVYDPFTEQEARAKFEAKLSPWTKDSETWLSLSINGNKTGEKLGSIGLKITNPDACIAEIGFMLKTSAQGKGYGFEALCLIRDYAFNTLTLNKLCATCASQNMGSYKLLEKAGFTREGQLKHNAFIGGEFIDDYLYGLCQQDR